MARYVGTNTGRRGKDTLPAVSHTLVDLMSSYPCGCVRAELARTAPLVWVLPSSFIESDAWRNCKEEEGNELPLKADKILLEAGRGDKHIDTSMDGVIGAGCTKQFQKPTDKEAEGHWARVVAFAWWGQLTGLNNIMLITCLSNWPSIIYFFNYFPSFPHLPLPSAAGSKTRHHFFNVNYVNELAAMKTLGFVYIHNDVAY